jgi:hypothetical protein
MIEDNEYLQLPRIIITEWSIMNDLPPYFGMCRATFTLYYRPELRDLIN